VKNVFGTEELKKEQKKAWIIK